MSLSTTRADYATKMKHQLDELTANIDALEAKTEQAKVEAREIYRAELAKLRLQSKLAMAQLAEMQAAGEEGWDKMVTKMEKVRDAFSHSFHYFKTQL